MSLDYVKCAQGMLAKSEGRDKLLATLQYAAMFAAAGVPGSALQVQKNLGAARKPFRVLKPVEALLPLLTAPAAPLTAASLANQARSGQARALKALSMAAFFGFDHVVWAGSAGLVEDKALVERAQRLSFYGWLLGSLCTLAVELAELRRLKAQRDKAGGVGASAAEGTQAAPTARETADATAASMRAKVLAAATAGTQAALAAALLKLLPLSPRATGALGVTTSALALYQLLPPLLPPAKAKKE